MMIGTMPIPIIYEVLPYLDLSYAQLTNQIAELQVVYFS